MTAIGICIHIISCKIYMKNENENRKWKNEKE
jgi:hypothetical protein